MHFLFYINLLFILARGVSATPDTEECEALAFAIFGRPLTEVNRALEVHFEGVTFEHVLEELGHLAGWGENPTWEAIHAIGNFVMWGTSCAVAGHADWAAMDEWFQSAFDIADREEIASA